MYCQKCGTQVAEGSAFCPKCGTKLVGDEAVSQTTAIPQHEPIASVSTITEDTQQAPSNNTTKVNGGLRKVANIGRVLLGISILLLLLCSLFSLPINPIIIVGGVAIGTILSALGLKRPFGMTKIIELVVACILLVAAIAYAVSFSGGRGDKYVQMVRGGFLDGYPQKTVGEAFDDFLDNPKWESGVSEDGERFVNVKGGILYLNKEAELAVQFFVDEKNEAFQYNACEINGVPQNNLIFWGLLEAVYSNNPASTTGVPQNTSSENRIEVGETQTFDGRLEVTLEYVEFVSQIQSELVGAIFPEDGNIFLRATFTVRNIGTKQGGISPLLSTVTYDNSFEFDSNPYSEDGNITNVNPLAQPSTGSMSFEVSSIVAESDKSLVINISENVIGGDIISFVVRPDANTSGESGTKSSYPFISYGYQGIEIDYLLESIDNVIFQLGDSQLNDEFKLRYDDLEFYHDNGAITSIVCTDPSLLEADGVPLNKNREGLISIFGQPHKEGNDGGGYFMRYDLPNCSLYFELGEPDSEAWRISISPNEAIGPAPGEILYNGEPIAHLLGRKLEELDKVFGAPTGGTPVDGSLFFGGTEYCSYDNIYFTSEQGYIDLISGDASHMTVNGTTLDKDRAGIIALFGEPVLEEDVPGFEDEGIADCHVMQYNLYNMYVISIEMPDVNSKATSVSISRGEVSP